MKTFSLAPPKSEERHVLVEVPHAGLAIPEAVSNEVTVTPDEILRDSDTYVDRLYEAAPSVGATLLAAHVSRYVIDLNRAPDDVDLKTVPDHPDPRGVQPRGVVWRLTTDGRPALKEPLTYEKLSRRLAEYHEPYHAAISELLAEKRDRFGHAVLLAAHSMPSSSRTPGARNPRADVVPGTRGRSTAAPSVIECVEEHFTAAGLSVRHDDPYRGGWTTMHYGRPHEGWHAIQVELNRSLYIDEDTSRPKDGDFEELQRVLTELVGKLGSLEL